MSTLRFRLVVGLFAVLMITALAVPPQAARAAGESQLRIVGGQSCLISGIGDVKKNCLPLKVDLVSITGYNQRGDRVTWTNPKCEPLSSFEVPNWWWDFNREVIVEVSAGQRTQKITLKRVNLNGNQWATVAINHTINNNIDMGLSAQIKAGRH